ncbi:MAG: hypothetical protein GWM88_06365, partial [Pseudomonadales bacterium]|nr:hypothetical protein [Pseudomonadales bacterium]NIX07647.1 hypothetical protein [Pseudomonadales bacterium]
MNPLWIRQIRGILSLELRKNFLSTRAVPLYAMSLLPVGVMLLALIVSIMFDGVEKSSSVQGAAEGFANAYQFMLRGLLYFGCVWIFMNLFRGEVLDRSLHYYFLAPIRREVLVAGKFVSGLIATFFFFGFSVLITM